MSALTFETLMDSALGLPLEQRSHLANRLIESIDEDDSTLSPEWNQEIDRRIEAARRGSATRVSHEEVMNAVRKEIAGLQQ